jgi:hypothetical protein
MNNNFNIYGNQVSDINIHLGLYITLYVGSVIIIKQRFPEKELNVDGLDELDLQINDASCLKEKFFAPLPAASKKGSLIQ